MIGWMNEWDSKFVINLKKRKNTTLNLGPTCEMGCMAQQVHRDLGSGFWS